MGIYSNSVVVLDRAGLPRKYLKELADDLSQCPKVRLSHGSKLVDCPHGQGNEECRRYCFTALHKQSHVQAEGAAGAGWEVSAWQDGQLIVSYSNFFSTSRCGLISRGAHKSRHSYSVWAPEPIWHYNLLGRSATDGCDQQRKKMSIAERRIVRAGVKGISFVFDLMFTNASIMWNFVNRDVTSRAQLDKKFSKVCFVVEAHGSHMLTRYATIAGNVLSSMGREGTDVEQAVTCTASSLFVSVAVGSNQCR